MSISKAMGWDNPYTQFIGNNRNTLMGFGAGLASGRNIGDGVANGLQFAQQGKAADLQFAQLAQEEAEAAQAKNATLEWLRSQGYSDLVAGVEGGGLDMGTAWGEALRRSQPQAPGGNLMSVGGHLYDKATGQWISPPETAENRQNISLTPQWGIGPDGQPAILQTSSTGDLVPATLPEGYTLASPYELNADRAAGTAYGRNTGGAQFDLPAAELMANQTIKAIQDVKANASGMDEQFGNILGVPQQMTPAWPGSPKANFQVAVGRLTNRAFLEAREVLRGGGQITDFESRKAEGAITNMEDAMARGDKALFQSALNEFEQAVRDGLAKLQQQAGAMPGYAGGQRIAPAQGGGFTILGVE